jgi:hypothetical protein
MCLRPFGVGTVNDGTPFDLYPNHPSVVRLDHKVDFVA